MVNKKSNKGGDDDRLVYSTNPKTQEKINASDPPSVQKLRVRLEKNGRGGKMVSLIYGWSGNEKDLNALAKTLKSSCGTGGSAKNGEILIQGNHVEKIIDKLKDLGYNQTKKGGG